MKKFNERQLFTIKRKGLEAKFQKYLSETGDGAHLIQCAVVVMLRNAFSVDDLSFVAKEIIRSLFLKQPTELITVRHLSVFFEAYFETNEWEKVITALFKDKQEYLRLTKYTRLHTDHLQQYLHCGSRDASELMNLAAVFKDETGKNHRFTIKNVDPCYSVQETNDLLAILGTLTLFQKDGLRRFTELVRYNYLPITPVYDSQNTEETTTTWVKSHLSQLPEALEALEEAKTAQMEQGVLITTAKSNVYYGKTPEEIAVHLFEGIQPILAAEPAEILSQMVTALTKGIRLTDAAPEYALISEAKEQPEQKDIPKKPAKKPQSYNLSGHLSGKKNVYLTKEELEQQRQQRKKDRWLKKQINKKKKGKKKR